MCRELAKDFVVSGTANESLYGACESMYKPDMVGILSRFLYLNIIFCFYLVMLAVTIKSPLLFFLKEVEKIF